MLRTITYSPIAVALFCLAMLGGSLAPAAFADTITTFTLNNVAFVDGGTAAGSITLDSTTNAITTFDIVTAGTTVTPPQTFNLSNNVTAGDVGTLFCRASDATCSFGADSFTIFNGTDALFLVLTNPLSLTGSNALNLDPTNAFGALNSDLGYDCDSTGCTFGNGLVSGTLDGPVAAPEPPSALLLLAGLMGLLALPMVRFHRNPLRALRTATRS